MLWVTEWNNGSRRRALCSYKLALNKKVAEWIVAVRMKGRGETK
jgi:hypothetical protein